MKILLRQILCVLTFVPSTLVFAQEDLITALSARVQTLEDKEAIRTLLLSYGRFVDERDWEAFADLFANNGGTWNGGMGVASGRQEIITMMEDTLGDSNSGIGNNSIGNLHLVSNEFISVEGDQGNALSKWVFVMTDETGGPDVVFIGHYVDELTREQGTWKFKERVVFSDISSSIPLDGLE